MTLTMDADLKTVAEFMQAHIPADRLVQVADRLAAIAPVLWGDAKALALVSDPIVPAVRRPAAANGSPPAVGCAVDGFVAAADSRH